MRKTDTLRGMGIPTFRWRAGLLSYWGFRAETHSIFGSFTATRRFRFVGYIEGLRRIFGIYKGWVLVSGSQAPSRANRSIRWHPSSSMSKVRQPMKKETREDFVWPTARPSLKPLSPLLFSYDACSWNSLSFCAAAVTLRAISMSDTKAKSVKACGMRKNSLWDR